MKLKLNKAIVILALGLTPQAFAADVSNADITTPQSSLTGAELNLTCAGSLTGLHDRETSDRQTLAYASGGDGANTPGAIYSADDAFSIDASCAVLVSIGCAAGFESAGTACQMVRLEAGDPVATPGAADIIEDLDISFVNGATASTPYADLDLGAGAGVTNETDLAVRYEATLGATAADNQSGDYRVDIDITIVEN